MGASTSSAKEDKDKRKESEGGVSDEKENGHPISPDEVDLGVPVPSKPIDIPKASHSPPGATAWVGSTNSPPDLADDTLGSTLPPLDSEGKGGDAAGADAGRPRSSGTKRFTFRWTGPAQSVSIAGSFNNWSMIPLSQVGHNEWLVEMDLEPKQHEYKYVVDGKWQHDPLAPVVASGLGSLNNLLNIASAGAAEDGGSGSFDDFGSGVDDKVAAFARGTPPGEYSQSIPAFDEADAPPLLPPHLKEATLNSEPLRNDPSELPVPNHVVLDHLYAQSVKDSVLVLGATQRYRRKFITTVLHKPLN